MNQELQSEREALETLSRLPLSPIALRILEITKNEKAPVQTLAEVISTDFTLAARLLSLANFTSGLTQKLTTVFQAINALGLDIVKSLALGLTVFPFESSRLGRDAFTTESECPITLQQLWEHALGCAILAGRLGALIEHGSRHQAFAAGFLHDIGRVILFRYWRESLFEAFAVAEAKNIPVSEAETLAFGRNHIEIGELWSHTADLSPMLQCAIGYHHRSCSIISGLGEEQRRLVAVVQLADVICEANNIAAGGDPSNIPNELWQMLNLQAAEHRQEIEIIKQKIEGSRELFGFQQKATTKFPRVRSMVRRDCDVESSGPKAAGGGGKGRVIPFPSRTDIASAGSEKSRDKKLTILVVEDHGSLCDLLRLYFMRYGYHVRTANDGQSALDILGSEQIDLVLLDLMLPRVDGFAVLRHMREQRNDKHPYVIVVSAGASAKDRNRVLELGANEYMPKPFHLMRLLERIQNVEKYLFS